MSFYWNAPSISRWTVWSCRGNRVTAFDTSKHSWSCDRCVSMSIHILSRTGIEIEVNVNAGFCLGLASAMGFPEAVFSSFAVGIDSVTYSSTPFTVLTLETVLSWKWDLTVFMMTNFYVQDWSDACVLENPSSCTSFLLVSRHCLLGINVVSPALLLYLEYRSIVLFRQASNPRQSIVWIVYGLRTSVRIFARILAPISPLLCIGRSFCNRKVGRNFHLFQMIKCIRILRNPHTFG